MASRNAGKWIYPWIRVGVNDLKMMPLLLEHFEMDFFLVAMPYTLLNQEPLEKIFPECQKRGMGVILGAPYA